jgi:hypothetical protein
MGRLDTGFEANLMNFSAEQRPCEWDGLRPVVVDGRLQIPLFHGTSSLWLDSIQKHGLGGTFPFIRDALGLLPMLHQLVPAEHRDITVPNMISQKTDHMNWQHGQVYFSLALEDAVRYAQSNGLGSELLSVVAGYAEHVGADARLPIWLLDLKRAAKSPGVLAVNDVAVSSLETERGGDPHVQLAAFEAERVAADAQFSEIEAAREECRAGCFDRIKLAMDYKGKNDRSSYVLESLRMFELQNTFRLKPGLTVPWQAIEVICVADQERRRSG